MSGLTTGLHLVISVNQFPKYIKYTEFYTLEEKEQQLSEYTANIEMLFNE